MQKSSLLGVLKGLIHRAHKLMDRIEDLIQELQLLNDIFISNGHPVKLAEQTIEEPWTKQAFIVKPSKQ
jgi:hypothetical protein